MMKPLKGPIARATFLALGLTLAFAPAASADTAGDFLKKLEGSYSGRGTAKILGSEDERIACKITNTYDAAATRLSLTGECASTKGKNPVSGSVTASGGALTGTFVAPSSNMKVTRSSGSIEGGRMVLLTALFDEKAGNLIRVRQEISAAADGITAMFFTYDNASGEYEKSGTIEFRRR